VPRNTAYIRCVHTRTESTTAAPAEAARLTVLRPDASRGAAEDLDGALELLRAVARGDSGPLLRLYRPLPTLAFGQRDARLEGFAAAEAASRALGFEPLVRKAGGRAAAYHQGCLVVDHIEPDSDAIAGSRPRFAGFGELLAGVLRDVGVDAAVGEISGEYCPGEFSVHGRASDHAAVKLVGTAQRVIAGAWLFSSVIVVEHSPPIRQVLTETYDALGLHWDPRTAGAADDLVPGLRVSDVEEALLAAYARRGHQLQ
jgi:octanoyl-[GcvH]:protein N-octanoyltransferase